MNGTGDHAKNRMRKKIPQEKRHEERQERQQEKNQIKSQRDARSNFFDKLGFETHRAKAVYFAIDIMIAIDQTNIFDFGSHLEDAA